MKYFEPELSSYNTRCDNIVHTRAVKSVYNGTETVSFRAQKTWDMVPDDIKNVTSLNELKTKIAHAAYVKPMKMALGLLR